VLDLIFSWNPFRSSPAPARPAPPPSAREKAQRARQEQARLRLQKDWQAKVEAIGEKWKRLGEQYTEIHLSPRRADVRVTHFGLAWVPSWQAIQPGAAAEIATKP